MRASHPDVDTQQGNGSASNKLPREFGALMQRRRMTVFVEWASRATKWEADVLANGSTSALDPSTEVRVVATALLWGARRQSKTQLRRSFKVSSRRTKSGGGGNRKSVFGTQSRGDIMGLEFGVLCEEHLHSEHHVRRKSTSARGASFLFGDDGLFPA